MKIAITGHTKGIGKSLFDKWASHGHSVIGFSRSNGFNVADPKIRSDIIKEIIDCDIFINNAYANDAQIELLKSLIPLWEGTDKQIININSKVSIFGRLNFQEANVALHPISENGMTDEKTETIQHFYESYANNKIEQVTELTKKLFLSSPRILNVICGYADTPMVNAYKFKDKMMSPNDIANLIYDLTAWKDRIYIQEITIDGIGIDYTKTSYDYDEFYDWIINKYEGDALQ